jgi:ATP-binding cassette subfamily F protein uup
MNYLTIENVSKSYGEKLLFQDLSLRINAGDKVAIIARNGSGKSTLLRMIAGIEPPEGVNPALLVAKGIHVGYLPQEPDFESHEDIFDYVTSIDKPVFKALHAFHAAQVSDDPQAMQKATHEMDEAKAWDTEARVMEMLHEFGFYELTQHIDHLSGGQKKRIALVRLLLEEPDFLILDEPTNHLDVHIIEWLEDYLSKPQLALLMVTHDRYFLNRVCNQICEIHRGNLVKYRGNYNDYLEKKALLVENESIVHDKTKKLMRKELEWVRRMPKARTTKAKSRLQAFDEIKKLASQKLDDDSLQMQIDMTRLGSKIVEFHNVGFAYDGKRILEGFNYKFKKDDRIGLIGPNGVGKSTFIRLLLQEQHVQTGKVIHGDTVRFGYYRQEGYLPDKDQRVIDVVRNVAEYLPLKGGRKLTAESLLEQFLFPRPQQQVYYSQLSGGERRRLYLLTILMRNPNFLIFDEPTNDLDIITLNVLEEFLLAFEGVLIIVTHDRFILDKLVDHLFVMEGNGQIKDFPGNYSQYISSKISSAPENTEGKKAEPSSGALAHADRKQLKKLEKEIEKLEARKKELIDRLYDPALSLEQIQSLSSELAQVKEQLDEKEMEWLEKEGLG